MPPKTETPWVTPPRLSTTWTAPVARSPQSEQTAGGLRQQTALHLAQGCHGSACRMPATRHMQPNVAQQFLLEYFSSFSICHYRFHLYQNFVHIYILVNIYLFIYYLNIFKICHYFNSWFVQPSNIIFWIWKYNLFENDFQLLVAA